MKDFEVKSFESHFLEAIEYFKNHTKQFLEFLKSNKQDLIYNTYTHLIQKGIFPFQLELNTQNARVIHNRLYNFFVPDAISPWSPKFHCSFIIANIRYSFTPNDLMNKKM